MSNKIKPISIHVTKGVPNKYSYIVDNVCITLSIVCTCSYVWALSIFSPAFCINTDQAPGVQMFLFQEIQSCSSGWGPVQSKLLFLFVHFITFDTNKLQYLLLEKDGHDV